MDTVSNDKKEIRSGILSFITFEHWLHAIFFVGCFVYLWLGVQSHLIYFSFGVFNDFPGFSWETAYLADALRVPGEPVKALDALLSQGYYSDWLGALIIVAVLMSMQQGLRRLLRSLPSGIIKDLSWVPILISVTIYNQYDNPLAMLLSLTSAIWGAVAVCSLPIKTVWQRVGVSTLCFCVTYYVTGGTAFVLALIVGMWEVFERRSIIGGVSSVLLAILSAFVLTRFLFHLHLDRQTIFFVGTPWGPGGRREWTTLSYRLLVSLYACGPGLLLCACLWSRLKRHLPTSRPSTRKRRRKSKGREPEQAKTRMFSNPKVRAGVRSIILGAAISTCLIYSRTHIRYERMLHYSAFHRDWPRVLDLARTMKGRISFTRSGLFDINRALAHTGRLGNDLCAYPQEKSAHMFLSHPSLGRRFQHAKLLELYLDLGDLNAAERCAYELLENNQTSVYALGAIVRVHLAKGQDQAARVVLRALRKQVRWNRYLGQWPEMKTDPDALKSAEHIKAWDNKKCTTNYTLNGISVERLLLTLLHDHPDHRLACDYLLCYYLLEHRRDKFVQYLTRMRSLGYERLPRNYAEALLLHSLETKTPLQALGWTIDPSVQRQFQQTRAIVSQARSAPQAAYQRLAPQIGDSYAFYSIFNACGVK